MCPSPSRSSSGSDTSLLQLSGDIEECVSCLFKLDPILRDPAPRDIYKERVSRGEADEDIDLARQMFPKAALPLLRRFGIANWKRKQDLITVELQDQTQNLVQRRSALSKQEPRELKHTTDVIVPKSEALITASGLDLAASSPGSSHTGAASVNESIFSRMDYFSSRAATSIADSDYNMTIKRLDVPKAPAPLRPGSTFDCPYCGQEIIFGLQVDSYDDWTAHVYLDLEPYLCTFDNCLRADRPFGNREVWFQHELDHHRLRKVWNCQTCEHTFDKAEDMELHLSEEHERCEDRSQLSFMVSLCERYSGDQIPSQLCPFCSCRSTTTQMLKEHIADHMEQLALNAIQVIHGLQIDSDHSDIISEKRAKLEDLNKFIKEQQGYFWKPLQESFDVDSADSNVAFAEDSDDEVVHHDVHPPPPSEAIGQTTVSRGGRPSMQRRGNSWMTKVNSFLRDQPANSPGAKPWLSKVQTFLDTQSAEGPSLEESQRDSPIQSPLDDVDTTDQEIVPAVPTHCLRTKPPSRNKDFVGRDPDLSRLHVDLSRSGTLCILSGVGGIGKSETAIEYTYRFKQAYSYIFWVAADSAMSCANDYSLIASEFVVPESDASYDQSRLITLGREFLEQCCENWLLIFDNATSWQDIERFIPLQLRDTTGSILVTSRTTDLANFTMMPECQYLTLEPLTVEESRLFLLRSMDSSLGIHEVESHPEYRTAGRIAKEAEGLPLALSQIAAYVQVSECSLAEFVQLWNERRRHAMMSSQSSSSTASAEKALETIWGIGLREVTIDARELLNILAFLDSDKIPRKLLVGEHEEPSLEFLHSSQTFRYDIIMSLIYVPVLKLVDL